MKFIKGVCCCLFLLNLYTTSFAEETVYPDFLNVEYVKNYDGDTVTVNIPNVPAILGDNISIRLNGVDTPEKKGKCDLERFKAELAKEYIENRLVNAKVINLLNPKRGKYFRIVADIVVDGHNLSDELLQLDLAVPYDGGTKVKNWCEVTETTEESE